MYGALLTEPERADSHAGVLFMHNEGFSTMCGHGIIAVVTLALERGLITPGGDGDRARARCARGPDPRPRDRRRGGPGGPRVDARVVHQRAVVRAGVRRSR